MTANHAQTQTVSDRNTMLGPCCAWQPRGNKDVAYIAIAVSPSGIAHLFSALRLSPDRVQLRDRTIPAQLVIFELPASPGVSDVAGVCGAVAVGLDWLSRRGNFPQDHHHHLRQTPTSDGHQTSNTRQTSDIRRCRSRWLDSRVWIWADQPWLPGLAHVACMCSLMPVTPGTTTDTVVVHTK